MGGRLVLRCVRTSLLKHLIMLGMRTTGQKSLRLALVECLGTDTMEVVLKHVVIVLVFDVSGISALGKQLPWESVKRGTDGGIHLRKCSLPWM